MIIDLKEKYNEIGWERWLTPVIPGTQEAEIKRIMYQRLAMSQAGPGKKLETPDQQNSWEWWHMLVIPITQAADVVGSQSEANPGKKHKNWSEK
jgi:hypothetical protein